MVRIFTVLAVVNALALVAAFVVGVVSKLGDSLNHPHDPTYMIHFHLGLYTAILTLGVHSLIFIYFLGTGRWVKEVALAYKIPDAPLPRLTRELKRRTFPAALFAMLTPIATAAAGAGAQMREWPWTVHLSLAIISLLVNAWAFRVEYRNVTINSQVILDVFAEVERIRAERGLPTSEATLAAEKANRAGSE